MARIRKATAGDLPGLIRMAGDFLRSTPFGQVLSGSHDALEAVIRATLTGGVIFVAEDDSAEDPHDRRAGARLVGMIAGTLERTITGDCIGSELVWWVEPAYRKTRLGPYLLRSLEDWTRQEGGTVLKMVAPAGSTVGNYYERLGYSPIETAHVKRL
jgi:GNAT superfamily N-acetyltransferase